MTVHRVLTWDITSLNQQHQEVRRSIDGGEYITIATLPSTDTAYVDTEDYLITTGVEYVVVSVGSLNGSETKVSSASIGIRPTFTEWSLTTEPTLLNGQGRFTASKTNQYVTYESYANLDLTVAIIQSFHDADMQQWQGFKDAIGSNSFTWDGGSHISFNKVRYKGYGYIPPATSINWGNPAIFYVDTLDYGLFQNTAIQQFGQTSWDHMRINYFGPPDPNQQNQVYELSNGYNAISLRVVEETIQVTMTFVEIAQKIISNLQSSNESTSLLAEAYLEAVAKSINQTDVSKQFVKLSDLVDGFETNKTIVGV